MTRDEITRRVRRGLNMTRAEASMLSCAGIARRATARGFRISPRAVARIHAGTTIETLAAIAVGLGADASDRAGLPGDVGSIVGRILRELETTDREVTNAFR